MSLVDYIWGEIKSLFKKMKHYASLIHSILIFGLILVVAYLYCENTKVNDLLNSGVISSVVPKQGIPNSHDNISTGTIITFLGVGMALFAFLSFQSLKDFFRSKVKDMEKKHKAHKKENEKQYHKLISLENELNYQYSIVLNGHSNRESEQGDEEFAIVLRFMEIEAVAKIIFNPIGVSEDYLRVCKLRVSSILNNILTAIVNNRIEYIPTEMVDSGTLRNRIENILKVVDGDDLVNLNLVTSYFKSTNYGEPPIDINQQTP